MKNTRTQPTINRTVAGILCGFALAGIGQAASSAILYYDFESSTDNLAIVGGITDQSTTGNDATAGTRETGSAPTFSTSNGLTHSTGSLSFTGDGADGGIVTSTGDFSITGDAARSVSLWLNTSAGDKDGTLVEWGGTSSLQRITIRLDTDGSDAIVRTEFANAGVDGTAVVSTGSWTNVIVTYDGSEVNSYINGTQDITSFNLGTLNTQASSLFLGYGDLGGKKAYNGLLDDVAIFDRVLTSSEISSLASGASPLAIPEPSALGLLGVAALGIVSLRRRTGTAE